jgi:hypothetical protein
VLRWTSSTSPTPPLDSVQPIPNSHHYCKDHHQSSLCRLTIPNPRYRWSIFLPACWDLFVKPQPIFEREFGPRCAQTPVICAGIELTSPRLG